MPEDELKSRRQFLRRMAFLFGCQAMSSGVFAASSGSYKIGPWTGDDFTLGHRLRANELPLFPEKAERKVDFIIVGGGVAGLTAAYKLKSEDFLLLEQYDELGGQSRGGNYCGIDYSRGAAYIGIIDGIYGELYSELGISPLKLSPERNGWHWQGKFFNGVGKDQSTSLSNEFKRLLNESRTATLDLQLGTPPGEALDGARARLDQALFSECVSSYSPQFMSLIDSYVRSSYCGGIDQISALAGYGLISSLVDDDYVFKGGNSAIARALSDKARACGPKRCLSGAFVWKIELREDSASVVYSEADGSVHRVDCRHAIVATPPMVAWRQITRLPDRIKAQLMQFKFGSYLVANMLMKKRMFTASYDNYVGTPYSFADVIVAETPYMMTGSYRPEMGSVLTIYQPYPAGSAGRTELYLGDKERFASSLVSQMNTLAPGFDSALAEIQLTRWGHALAIVGPGYYSRLAKLKGLMESEGPFSLAHSTTQGMPAAESAIRAGIEAAKRARSSAAKTNISALF